MAALAGPDGTADLYTDVETVKAALGKQTSDDRDELIAAALQAACRMIDRRCGRQFYQDETPTVRSFPVAERALVRGGEQVLLVDDVASLDGLLVHGGGAGAWSPLTGWEPGPDAAIEAGQPVTELLCAGVWLPGSGRVRVTARWGWPVVPAEIAQAALLLAARLYRRKDSPQGVIASADWGSVRVSRTDPDVEALLAAFIEPVIV